MSNVQRLPTVPVDYASRRELWLRSGVWLAVNQGPLVSPSVFDLGHAERSLLEMEERIASTARDRTCRTRGDLIDECFAHSKLWVFGLYEIVRVVKATNRTKFAALKTVFHDLEILRMPLAKHEVKGSPTPHYPTGLWSAETGRVGWHVFDPEIKAMKTVTRRGVADEFLALTAAEPVISDG